MANLHYENLVDTGGSPDALMASTDREFGPISRYLKLAQKWLLQQTLKLAWEPDISRVPNSRSKAGKVAPAGRTEPVWGILKETQPDEPPETFEEFYNARFVSDDPGFQGRNIRVLDSDAARGALELESLPRGKILFLKPNTYQLEVQLKALWRLQNNPEEHHRALLRLAEWSDESQWPPCPGGNGHHLDAPSSPNPWGGQVDPNRDQDAGVTRWFLLKDKTRLGTAEQRRFVDLALGTPDFAILEGPPGSGKTVTICELVLQELSRGRRVLLCASTHVAVDNCLEILAEKGFTRGDVIAVRIGDPINVSDLAQPFVLQTRLESERKDLLQGLSKLKRRSPAQEHLFRALQDESNESLLRIVLDCSNLVCGTTIGILQHPDIKASRFAGGCLFDTLIIDEASKTTFQEFLVPALLARRWILVGDVRQLSPYVDQGYVEANVASLVPEDDGHVASVLQASKWGPVLVAHPDDSMRERFALQSNALGKYCVRLEGNPSSPGSPAPMDLLGAFTIVAKPEVLQAWEPWLPSDVQNLSGQKLLLLRRRWQYLSGQDGSKDLPPQDPETWAYEVAWRMIRTFELRKQPSQRTQYENDLNLLVPQWYTPDRQADIRKNLDLIRKVAFPSVLELLQEGFERRPGQPPRTALRDGLPDDVLGQRHVRLEYQHRMHPEISQFPRSHIYESAALKDAEEMDRRRQWPNTRYSSRSVWIDVKGELSGARDENLAEVEQVIRELNGFLAWAAVNPRSSIDPASPGPWEVAVLTFYLGQEEVLRQRLRTLFRTQGRQSFTRTPGNVRVLLGTVNRFQGHEADVVFLSFVRNRRTGIGFLDVPNRLNVALTRSRYQRVLIGDHSFFARQGRSELLRDLAKEHHPEIAFSLGGGRTSR